MSLVKPHMSTWSFLCVRIHIHSGQMTVEYDRFLGNAPMGIHRLSLAKPGVIIGQAPWKTPHQKMHTVDMWNIKEITFHRTYTLLIFSSSPLKKRWSPRRHKPFLPEFDNFSFGLLVETKTKTSGSPYIVGCGPLQGFQWQPRRFFPWNPRAWNLTNWYPTGDAIFFEAGDTISKAFMVLVISTPLKANMSPKHQCLGRCISYFPTETGSHFRGPRIVRFSGVGFSIHVGNLHEAQLGIGWSTRIVDCLGSLAGIFHVGRRLERNCSNKTDLLLRWFQELVLPPPQKRLRLIWILKGCFSWHLNQLC